jgi:effector-binding domain-containing protein
MTTYAIESRLLSEQDTAVQSATLRLHEIGPWLERTFPEVAAYLDRKGAGPSGPPFARYHRVVDDVFELEAGFVATTPTAGEGEVEPSELPAGLAAVTKHFGACGPIEAAYDAIETWLHAERGVPVGDPWEVYFDDPDGDVDPAFWKTEIVQPYRVLDS